MWIAARAVVTCNVSAASAGWCWRSAEAALPVLRRRNHANRRRHHRARIHRRPPRGNSTQGRHAPRSERLASLPLAVLYCVFLWHGNTCFRIMDDLIRDSIYRSIIQNMTMKLVFHLSSVIGVGYFVFCTVFFCLGYGDYMYIYPLYNVPSMCAC